MSRSYQTYLRPIGIILLVVLLIWVFCRLLGEVFWFQEVGYLPAYGLRLATKIVVWTIVTLVSATFLLRNLALAERLQTDQRQPPEEVEPIYNPGVRPSRAYRRSEVVKGFSLRWLLPFTGGLSLLLTLALLHYGKATWHLLQAYWQRPNSTLSLPERFSPDAIVQLGQALLTVQSPLPFLGLGLLLLGTTLFLVYPRTLFRVLSVLLSVGLGFILSANWDKLLLFFQQVPFDRSEPLFGQDIGFYVFSLPLWELVQFWLAGLFLVGLLMVALIYLLAGGNLSDARFIGFSRRQNDHLYWLGSGLMLFVGFGYWLSRFELLYSSRGVLYGAGFTDIQVNLRAYTLLTGLSLAIALLLAWQALRRTAKLRPGVVATPQGWLRSRTFLILSSYLVIVLVSASLLPTLVQRFGVLPNELALEKPYIRRTIALTREAFSLDQIDVQTFNPRGTLTAQAIQANDLTIRNIRLWDTRPLLQTIRQLQQFRPYYRFVDADIDRYSILREPTPTSPASDQTDKQQVLISARELDYSSVPQIAQTWVNEHLIYTHGYGFIMSPVNRVGDGGLPDYFVKDIGTGEKGDAGRLTTSSDQIRNSIPIDRPRIYYGEITNTYVMTNTKVPELDFPTGEGNAYNVYDGRGGVAIGPLWRRWLYAVYLGDWQMVFTNNFTDQTKLLFRRTITDRIRTIAPFLAYDQDPYLVVADTQDASLPADKTQGVPDRSYLYWILDAYTTNERYPYSEPTRFESDDPRSFNYIRNSVKVVVDAYHGDVSFYVADPTDPIIQTWSQLFPGMFKPIQEMPTSLFSHVRFPQDLFSVQAEQLLTYHMTDPQVFYNREDQWQVPTEIYGSEPQLVEPYYLIMELPTAGSEEFILLLPFTPRQRTNLTAWLASRSDGENYGKSLLYIFPKQELVFGPEQIEARINQDPIISQQISLWNRQGSQAIQGNLLVIPIEQSLLYVEPLYLEATQNSLPTLVRVIVAYKNRIVMAESLEQSLRAIFQPVTPTAPPIVRPVD